MHVVADTGLSSGHDERGADVDGRPAPAARGARRRVPRGRRATTSPRRSSTLARSENATQIVLGASGRSRWQELFSGSVINRVVRLSGPIDVHVISRPADGRRADGERRAAGRAAGAHAAVAAPPAVGLGARRRRAAADHGRVRQHPRHVRADQRAAALPRAGDGRRPRRRRAAGRRRRRRRVPARQLVLHAAATTSSTIADGENLLALVVYVVAAGIVAVLVDRVGRSRMRAARSQAEAEALAALAGSLARPGLGRRDARPAARRRSACRAAALLARATATRWHVARQLGCRAAGRSGATPTSAATSAATSTLALAGGHAVGRRRAGAQRVRRPGRRGRRARAAAGRGRQGRRPGRREHAARRRCCRPSRTTCARRWRRSRRRSPASASATSTGRRTTSTSSSGRSRRRPTASPTSSATCST